MFTAHYKVKRNLSDTCRIVVELTKSSCRIGVEKNRFLEEYRRPTKIPVMSESLNNMRTYTYDTAVMTLTTDNGVFLSFRFQKAMNLSQSV